VNGGWGNGGEERCGKGVGVVPEGGRESEGGGRGEGC